MTDELLAIAAEHYCEDGWMPPRCGFCHDDWPCTTSVLARRLAVVEAENTTRDRIIERMSDGWFFDGQAKWHRWDCDDVGRSVQDSEPADVDEVAYFTNRTEDDK